MQYGYLMRVKHSSAHGLLYVLVLSACVIDTVPLPEDTANPNGAGRADEGDADGPSPDSSSEVDASTLFTAGTESPVLLVGAAATMSPGATVRVVNAARSGWTAEAMVGGDGSFNLSINAALGEQVTVSEIVNGAVAGSLVLTLASPSADAYTAQGLLAAYIDAYGTDPSAVDLSQPGAVALYPPDAGGLITIIGTLNPGMAVVVANFGLGNATTAAVSPAGSFVARLAGASGQELGLFVVEAAASNAGAASVRVTVP